MARRWTYIQAEEGKLDDLRSLLEKDNMDYDYIGNRTVMVMQNDYNFHKLTWVIVNDCVSGYWY